jgi:hypothetical protein
MRRERALDELLGKLRTITILEEDLLSVDLLDEEDVATDKELDEEEEL